MAAISSKDPADLEEALSSVLTCEPSKDQRILKGRLLSSVLTCEQQTTEQLPCLSLCRRPPSEAHGGFGGKFCKKLPSQGPFHRRHPPAPSDENIFSNIAYYLSFFATIIMEQPTTRCYILFTCAEVSFVAFLYRQHPKNSQKKKTYFSSLVMQPHGSGNLRTWARNSALSSGMMCGLIFRALHIR